MRRIRFHAQGGQNTEVVSYRRRWSLFWPPLPPPHEKVKVPLIRLDVLLSDGVEDLLLLGGFELNPTTLIRLGLASPHRTKRVLFVGCVGSLEPGKRLRLGFPFPQPPFVEVETSLERLFLAVVKIFIVTCEEE